MITCVDFTLNLENYQFTAQISFSDGWCKAGHLDFGAQQNNDQRFHMDYGNHTFLHPMPWNEPENVAAIVYLADTGASCKLFMAYLGAKL